MRDDLMVLGRLRAQFRGGAIFARQAKPPCTLSERRMRRASSTIRRRPGWLSEVGAGMAGWDEALGELTAKEREYVVGELWFYASLHASGSDIRLAPVDGVWWSGLRVDGATQGELRLWALAIERYEECVVDDGQVRFLVDPSMFPLVYSQSTLVRLPSMSAAMRPHLFGHAPGTPQRWALMMRAIAKDPAHDRRDDPFGAYTLPVAPDWAVSSEYSWLPAEFQLDPGGRARIHSYINNLSPTKYPVFYSVIERIFSAMVPILEQVLTDLAHPRAPCVPCGLYRWWAASDEDASSAAAEADQEEAGPGRQRADAAGTDQEQRRAAWARYQAGLDDPQPGPFAASGRPIIPYTLCGRRLQAVVEMSDILLTPAAPKYATDWAVDGMANERIIATGVFHYAAENIGHSTIALRESVQGNIDYDAASSEAMARLYGLAPDERQQCTATRDVGYIEAPSGRCIVYPNTYQHRRTVRLADPTRPGKLRRIVFYFVDPSTRVPSSELVPPQQAHWLDAAQAHDVAYDGTYLRKRGTDLRRFAISPQQAMDLRASMKRERAAAMRDLDALFEPRVSPP
ncbi:hypothetical protein H4R18_002985 [Coemansia javaensis]|uniref:DUF4246 domain-containing protein n=1 Tax=Coemansia javaensis TaxID=2761396 RepID=A0A9W8HDH3_9FUNG|nr:hypothetical protein H4R18_002985 [Coemansia javaensis]